MRLSFSIAVITALLGLVMLLTCSRSIEPQGSARSIEVHSFISKRVFAAPAISDSASFSSCDTIHVNDSVQFLGFVLPLDSRTTGMHWDFGDSSGADSFFCVHRYAKSGIYSPIFSVFDKVGDTLRDTVTVCVNTPPDSVIILAPANGAHGQSLPPRLSWKGYDRDFFDSILTYTVVIVKDGVVTETILRWSDSTSFILDTGLNKGDSVSWWVTAKDKFGDTVSSKVQTFFTQLNNDASLSDCRVSAGEPAPAFSSSIFSYVDTVADTTATITLVPTAHDGHATIAINGLPVKSGNQSSPVPLFVGNDTVSITVTAADGITQRTYSIVVFRPPSHNALLGSLSLSTGALSPLFSDTIYTYFATLADSVKAISILPAAENGGATVTINGTLVKPSNNPRSEALQTGMNVVTIGVTSADGKVSKVYTVHVLRRQRAEARLSSLTVSAAVLTNNEVLIPAFSPDSTSYVLLEPVSVTSLTVVAAAIDSLATVMINGDTARQGNASETITLNSGKPVSITVLVTAQDTSVKKSYTIAVSSFIPRPTAPSDLTAVAQGVSSILLTWKSTSTYGKGFKIERAVSDSTAFSALATVGTSAVSFLDTALSPGVKYFYRLYAFNDSGSSAYSVIVSAVTRIPLAVNVLPAGGGTVTRAPDQSDYVKDLAVSLTAIPSQGYHFVNWTGSASGSANPLSLTMDSVKTMTAHFDTSCFTVTASASNGTVSKMPDKACFTFSDTVTLTAKPAAGYHFAGWGGDTAGTSNPMRVVVKANKTVTAQFTDAAPVLLCCSDTTITEGVALEFQVVAKDPDSDAVTFLPATLPAGATFSTSTGVFYWQPTHAQVGAATATFVATDGLLMGRKTVTITVRSLPVISIQPDSQSACAGQPVTFRASASGASPMTFKWTRNDSIIAGAVDSLLTIAAVSQANAGAYSCLVSNNAGTVTSMPAVLKVDSLSVDPTGVTASLDTVCPGSSSILSVQGGKLGSDAAWKWYFGSCGGTAIGSGTSITVSPTSNTVYFVRAEGTCNVTACASVSIFMKTVSTAATMALASPTDVCPGSKSTLSLVGGSLGNGAAWKWYSGTCGGTLVGTGASVDVYPTSTTTYYVRAEGDCGNTICRSVTLTLKTQSTPPSTISMNPAAVCPGGQSILSINDGVLGTGATWKWYSDSCEGTYLGTGSAIAVSPNVTTQYFIRGEGSCGSTSCVSGTVVLNIPTSISTQPQNVTVHLGNTASFNVTASGTGLTYQWQRKNIGGDWNNVSTSNIYSFTTSTGDHGALFKCIITGACGNVTSNQATLALQYQLAIDNNGYGSTSPAKGNTWVNHGESIPISATPNSTYHFVNWTSIGSATITNPNSSATSIALTGNCTVKANFATTLTVRDYTPGGYSISNPFKVNGITYPSAVYTLDVIPGQTVSVEATNTFLSGQPPPVSRSFNNWQILLGAPIFANQNAYSTTLTITGEADISAYYK
jgi:uncharacterized repeat protein (TIGR02543 family)